MSIFSNFNFFGRRYCQGFALPSRFYPDAFQDFNYSENFFNFWGLVMVVLPLRREASKIATAEFLEALTVISPFNFFPPLIM